MKIVKKILFYIHFITYMMMNRKKYSHSELAEQLIEKYPKESLPYNFLGDTYFLNKEYKKAAESFVRSCHLENKPYQYRRAGDAFYQLKDYKKCALYYGKALELFSSQSKIYRLNPYYFLNRNKKSHRVKIEYMNEFINWYEKNY